MPASGRSAARPARGRNGGGVDADGGEVVEQRLVLGVLEEVEDARGDDRADLGDRLRARRAVADAERVERREPLGQDLGAPGADVADRQAGQEPVERPGLARLERRDEVLRPTSCPSVPGRPGSPRRAGRGRPGS